MARNNHLGKIRRGQVLAYGPGAIIDFRAGAQGGGPVSVIAAGLESWDQTARVFGNNDPHVVHEPRLQRVLERQYFRLPPVGEFESGSAFPERFLRGVRFPTWLLCPSCHSLKRASAWDRAAGDPARWCARCSTPDRRVFAVPSRFVVACENGHIDDFPWRWWLARRSGAQLPCRANGEDDERRCKLTLRSDGGSGLEGLRLRCHADGCGHSATMQGAFSADALAGLSCRRRRPWISEESEVCAATPRVLQRGASNLYFPVTFSTLSIPPWSDSIQEDIASIWHVLLTTPEPVLTQLIESAAQTNASMHSMNEEEYAQRVRRRIELANEVNVNSLRSQEYERLETNEESTDFMVRQEQVPPSLAAFFGSIGRVGRLREVRALTAFKRIYQQVSVEEPGRGAFGALSADPQPWLPAIEVRGEGIFVSFNEQAVRTWAENSEVVRRIARIDDAYGEEFQNQHDDTAARRVITPEFVLVHSLAHAVIKRLSFECGYDVASLRERIYVSQHPWMAGFLIYTSTSDADGTLGGLERQGTAARIAETIRAALADAAWCSSDPLCRNEVSSLSERLNNAACHGCLLLPETCCEEGNRFLDRLTLVGDAELGAPGFFDDFVETFEG